MKNNPYAKLLRIYWQLPTRGNVPDSLLQQGDSLGFNRPQQRAAAPWTLEEHFAVCEMALMNGASFAEADAYCADNCNGMTFGALYNFIQLLRNPMQA